MSSFIQPGQLARFVDRLRFLSEHDLKGSQTDFESKGQRLLAQAGNHPLALNMRAFSVLPETGLPAPCPSFGPVALLFSEGDTEGAKNLAEELVKTMPHPRSWANCGDLQLLNGKIRAAEASYRRAQETLGRIPPLALRMGRIEAARNDWKAAKRCAIVALTENPLYGSARYLYWEATKKLGGTPLGLPLPERVRFGPKGERQTDSSLSEAARLAWTAWAEVDQQAGQTEFPPKKSAYETLVRTWEKNRPLNPEPGYIEPGIAGDTELALFSKWSTEGLLEAYLWAIGLGRSNADTFREWLVSNKGRLNQFWQNAQQTNSST
jgi:tetratricopeptide (TPR) repeat protein